jgi:hypothetical protein
VRDTQAFIDSLGVGGGPMSGWLSCQTFFILPGTSAYFQMPLDAAAFGTEVRHKTWWKESGDHYPLATDILPSAAWRGRESELTGFERWNQDVNERWCARYREEVVRLRREFHRERDTAGDSA